MDECTRGLQKASSMDSKSFKYLSSLLTISHNTSCLVRSCIPRLSTKSGSVISLQVFATGRKLAVLPVAALISEGLGLNTPKERLVGDDPRNDEEGNDALREDEGRGKE